MNNEEKEEEAVDDLSSPDRHLDRAHRTVSAIDRFIGTIKTVAALSTRPITARNAGSAST